MVIRKSTLEFDYEPNVEVDTEFHNDYFQWLCDMICVNSEESSYWLLTKTLYRKEFFWTVANDDNRAADGKKLRERFANEMGINEVFDGPCTVLELLVGLAERCENMMADTGNGNKLSKWFWVILRNIGLDKFTDEAYVDLSGSIAIDEILNKVLERTYKRDGNGGLFPLKEPKKDQRKIEIWYQMCAYLVENYYIDDENV